MSRILGVTLFIACAAAAQDRAPLLTEDSYAKTRDAIVPCADELKWMEVGWRPTFWEAAVEGQRDRKPVLLWAMNGHPLACT